MHSMLNIPSKKELKLSKENGICISASDAGIVLLEENGFHLLNREKYTILEVIPEHIGKQLIFKENQFFNISIDSLNSLVQKYPIQKLELFANQSFEYFQNNISSTTKKINLEYPEELFFREIKTSSDTTSILFFPNPKTQTLQKQLKNLFHQKAKNEFLLLQKEKTLDSLKQHFYNSKNISEKEETYNKIKTLEKIKTPVFDNSKIDELQLKISELKKMDGNKYLEQKLEALKIKKEAVINETVFTGSITFIILN